MMYREFRKSVITIGRTAYITNVVFYVSAIRLTCVSSRTRTTDVKPSAVITEKPRNCSIREHAIDFIGQ